MKVVWKQMKTNLGQIKLPPRFLTLKRCQLGECY
jgi:hypothetical protein